MGAGKEFQLRTRFWEEGVGEIGREAKEREKWGNSGRGRAETGLGG